MAFTARCQWQRRTVTVRWDDGQLGGDAEFVVYLLSQEECGEPIGLDPDGRVVGVSFATKDLALDSLLASTGFLTSLEGDVDEDDLAAYLPADGRA